VEIPQREGADFDTSICGKEGFDNILGTLFIKLDN